MKLITALIVLSITTMAMAKDCYELVDEPTNLRNVSAPKEVCVSHLRAKANKLTGKLFINGKESALEAEIKDRVDLGVHFESASAMVYTENTYRRYCDELEIISLDLKMTLDYDGSLIGLGDLVGIAGYTPDICHTTAKTQDLVYKKVQ
ncbi:MAG: hypothetical protein CME62_05865 [Halobacteriovoraceae bacterium]|nr:hypothetical protein [Halobacteriovoraceae bacterium]|tara:strand:- start:9902 stop:10348 length:447 start_codon:yes stop_codon:yes gene_type:complete